MCWVFIKKLSFWFTAANLFLLIAITTGCATYSTPFKGMQAPLVTAISHPLDTEFDKTSTHSKLGRSRSHSILHLLAWGDASVTGAARDGGLTRVHYSDVEVLHILFGVYTSFEVVAVGE